METSNFNIEELKYLIGKYDLNEGNINIEEDIKILEEFPVVLRSAVAGLSDEQLDTPYREGGWTVRQVIHHLPDSHMNCYIRFRWALTEDRPEIKAYYEEKWAELPDAKTADPEISLSLLEAVHKRLVLLLKTLTPDEWKRKLYHPENGEMVLDSMLGQYAWHCKHHLAHIEGLKERKSW